MPALRPMRHKRGVIGGLSLLQLLKSSLTFGSVGGGMGRVRYPAQPDEKQDLVHLPTIWYFGVDILS